MEFSFALWIKICFYHCFKFFFCILYCCLTLKCVYTYLYTFCFHLKNKTLLLCFNKTKFLSFIVLFVVFVFYIHNKKLDYIFHLYLWKTFLTFFYLNQISISSKETKFSLSFLSYICALDNWKVVSFPFLIWIHFKMMKFFLLDAY